MSARLHLSGIACLNRRVSADVVVCPGKDDIQLKELSMTKTFITTSIRIAVVTGASLGMASLTACSQAPYHQAMNTSSHASMTAEQAHVVSSQADALVGSLKQLQSSTGDLQKPYTDFTQSLGSFKSSYSSLKSDLSAMLNDQKSYLATWNKENNSIKNASIKKVAMSRYDAAAKDFASLTTSANSVTTSGDEFVAYMDDLNTYLSTDLNAGGLASGAPLFSKADVKAAALKANLKKLGSSMQKVASDYAASGQGNASKTAAQSAKKSSWWW
ncbi:MAG: DUF2959 family protein [Phycisphaerae bacterium]